MYVYAVCTNRVKVGQEIVNRGWRAIFRTLTSPPIAAEKQIFGVNHRLLQTDVYLAKFSQPSEYLAGTKLTA